MLFAFEMGLGRLLRQYTANPQTSATDLGESGQSGSAIGVSADQAANDPIGELYLRDLIDALATHEAVDQHIRASARKILSFSDNNGVFTIRNAIAHPNRTWHPHYLSTIEALCLSEDVTAVLALQEVAEAYAKCETGQLDLPSADWLSHVKPPEIPNNLAEHLRAGCSGNFIGRSDERSRLRRTLQSPRANCVSIVGPGGIGKTAFVLKVLQDIVGDSAFATRFDRVAFVTGKRAKLSHSGPIPQRPDFLSLPELRNVIARIMGCTSFDECTAAFSDLKLLICIDNIEELVGDDQGCLEEFQLELPPSWVILLTSRVAVPAQASVLLKPLAAEDLKKIAFDRLLSHGWLPNETLRIACGLSETATSPLALVLAIDAIVIGGRELGVAIERAETLTSEFAFSTLIGSLDFVSRRVLDVVHASSESADLDSASTILSAPRSAIEESIARLRRANLVTQSQLDDAGPIALTPQVRELLARVPVSDLSRDSLFKAWIKLQTDTRRLIDAQSHLLPAPEPRTSARLALLRLAERTGRCTELDRAAKMALVDDLRQFESHYGESANAAWLLSSVYAQVQDGIAESSFQAERAAKLAPESWQIMRRLGQLKFEQGDFDGTAEALAPIMSKLKLNLLSIDLGQMQDLFTKYFQARIFAAGDRQRSNRQSNDHSWQAILDELQALDIAALEVNRQLCMAIANRRSVEREPNVANRMAALAVSLKIVLATFDAQGTVIHWWTSEVLALIRQSALAAKQDKLAASQIRAEVKALLAQWGSKLVQRHRDPVEMSFVIRDAETAFELNSDFPQRGPQVTGSPVTAEVEVIVYAPPSGRDYCFGEDNSGHQYFIHRSATRIPPVEFSCLKRGDRLVVIPDLVVEPGRAIRVVAAKIALMQTR